MTPTSNPIPPTSLQHGVARQHTGTLRSAAHAPDAWYVPNSTKTGYAISFTSLLLPAAAARPSEGIHTVTLTPDGREVGANMARADLILSLVRAGTRGNHAQFQKTVEALAADERAKKHTILADRLLAQLRASDNGHSRLPTPSSTRPIVGPLVTEVAPVRRLEDMVLPTEAEEVIRELVEEQHRADLLRSYNLEPRHRVLLAGPPGNGKTSLAEAIADALSLPLIVVRYEAIIGSYLGETAQRIGQLFEYARSRHCVLFFDEFDSVGKETR